MNTTKIIEEVSKEDFKEIVVKYSSKINVSSHAFDHLNMAQRNIFKDETLKDMIIKENPQSIGLQKNGRYAVFYKRKEGFTKLICEINKNQKPDEIKLKNLLSTKIRSELSVKPSIFFVKKIKVVGNKLKIFEYI